MQNLFEKFKLKYPQLNEVGMLEEIQQVANPMFFSENEIIMDYGSYVKFMPLLVDGVLKVSRENEEGQELFLYYLQSGDSCTMSFSCCLMHKKSEIRVVAEEDSQILAIPVRYMDEWMRKYPSWKNFVMKAYDDRMLELIKTIEVIAFQKMDERLIGYLHKKVEVSGSNIIEATHQSIANDLSASREAISRLLKQLEKQGKLELKRNKIIISK